MKNAKLDKYIFSTPDITSKTAPLQQRAPAARKPVKDSHSKDQIWYGSVQKVFQRCCNSSAQPWHPPESKQPEGKSDEPYKGDKNNEQNFALFFLLLQSPLLMLRTCSCLC